MKIALISLFASGAAARQAFGHLLVNGTETGKWQYVRDVANEPYWYRRDGYPDDYGKIYEIDSIDSPDFVCGREAFAAAAKTETADVIAGETVGFKIIKMPITAEGDEYYNDKYSRINTAGPVQIYLSKPPNNDLKTYKGDGDWFKIASLTAKDDHTWIAFNETSVNFTIPLKTPPGPYLMRIELFWLYGPTLQVPSFVNCAHINVIGPGGGKPESAGTIKFPGGFRYPKSYQYEDPGLYTTPEIAKGEGLLKYKAPGPAVWKE